MLTRSLTIGRIAGVSIRLDWSVVLIAMLILVQLGIGVLPAWHPDWTGAVVWSVATAATLLFFASILLHELAQVVVARMRGLRVEGVTLFLFGGVASFEGNPPTARCELAVAIAGPVASLVLGFAFMFAGGWLAGPQMAESSDPLAIAATLSPLATTLAWIGPINIVLGLFNLLPAFPLDGGRILRAIVWAVTDSVVRATRIAAGLGRILAWGLIIAGVSMTFGVDLPIVGSGISVGVWSILIGWFLQHAADASLTEAVAEQVLRGVPVEAVMLHDPACVSPDLTTTDFIEMFLLGHEQRCFPVVTDAHGLVGLACIDDVQRVPAARREATRIFDAMTPGDGLDVVDPDTSALDAIRRLPRTPSGHLPVVEDGHVVGLLRREDVARWLETRGDTMQTS